MRLQSLRSAPIVQDGDLLNAGNCAVGRAGFHGEIFAIEIGLRVGGKRNGGHAALLRTPVDESIFTYIKVA